MQRSGVAVIPTEVNSKIEYLVGNKDTVTKMQNACGVIPFAEETLSYLDSVSKALMKYPETKSYPDIITFAFWCRKANLLSMKRAYETDSDIRLGLGLSFHIAPSNVAVNFAYSAAVALLAGNACIVRVPSKEFPQIEIICRAFSEEMGQSARIVFVRYPRSKECNDFFSGICDARIIWGGDQTIREMRKSPIKPRAREITFADRYSIAVIGSEEYLKTDDHKRIAEDFYNDTYLSDQNACTSPRFVIWLGNRTDEAKELFWKSLHDILKDRYEIQGVQAVDKLTKVYRLGAAFSGSILEDDVDNLITRVNVTRLDPQMADYYGNSGFFIEYDAERIEDILPVCAEKLQTVSYLGIDPGVIQMLVEENNCKGIDRIVPMGHTMDFELKWDGYDLIRELSRCVKRSNR